MVTDVRARIVQYVAETMAGFGWVAADLARKAEIDPATAGDFLAGRRWPRTTTLTKLEAALDWPQGYIARALSGAINVDDEAPNLLTTPASRGEADPGEVLLHVPPETFEGLSELEREEVLSDARLRVLQRAREIRNRQ